MTPKRGEAVIFTPSVNRQKVLDFENPNDNYTAIVTRVYENSVDLVILGESKLATCYKVQHKGLAPTDRSHYEFVEHDLEKSL